MRWREEEKKKKKSKIPFTITTLPINDSDLPLNRCNYVDTQWSKGVAKEMGGDGNRFVSADLPLLPCRKNDPEIPVRSSLPSVTSPRTGSQSPPPSPSPSSPPPSQPPSPSLLSPPGPPATPVLDSSALSSGSTPSLVQPHLAFRVAAVNARSVRSKMDDLADLFLFGDIDIACISETWGKDNMASSITELQEINGLSWVGKGRLGSGGGWNCYPR